MGGGKAPEPPNYADAAKQGVYADLDTYPLRYLTEAASKMGGKVTIDGKTYDFTGLGDADNAAVMSDKMAQTLLDLQRDLGPEFVKQSIEELKQSDPQGYAARKELFDKIMVQADAHPDRPIADELQNSIVGELQKAGRLDARELEQVQQGVRGGQVARGNYLGNAATTAESGAVVKAGEAKRDTQQQQALGYLQSGVTPEDVEFRRLQQSLSNLGAFNAGTTPEAQFQTLSSAGNGAAPFIGGTPNSQTTNPNAAQQGVNNALSIYSGNTNWAQSQVNPYIAGLSSGIGAYNAYASFGGYKPPQTPTYAPAINDLGSGNNH